MKKKITVSIFCTMLFALCVPAEAQQPKKIYRIGYLSSVEPAADSPMLRQYGNLYASSAT